MDIKIENTLSASTAIFTRASSWTLEFPKDLNVNSLNLLFNESKQQPHKILTVKEWIKRKKVEILWEEKTGLDTLSLTEEYQKTYYEMIISRLKYTGHISIKSS